MKKKILVVDDSALMRRIVCDIINSDERFEVADTAGNGVDALELLSQKKYDAVVMDVVMPQMDGLTVLRELNKRRIKAKVLMNSTLTKEGADVTIQALDEGAMEFIHKPNGIWDAKGQEYKTQFLRTLDVVTRARSFMGRVKDKPIKTPWTEQTQEPVQIKRNPSTVKGKKLVAIASSTGGPKALQSVIPKLPGNLNAPVLLVQHMPAGFTASLAERLNSLSQVTVKEAAEGDILQNGYVYLAKGGVHLKVDNRRGTYQIVYGDEPTREGVKPCANYMYESLIRSDFEEICCVVMTGMGADGTKGIASLKKSKKVHVIAQTQDSCAVYGMPRSIVNSGLADEIIPLDEIAGAITKNVGVY